MSMQTGSFVSSFGRKIVGISTFAVILLLSNSVSEADPRNFSYAPKKKESQKESGIRSNTGGQRKGVKLDLLNWLKGPKSRIAGVPGPSGGEYDSQNPRDESQAELTMRAGRDLERAAKLLDEAQRCVDEWGHAAVSASVLVPNNQRGTLKTNTTCSPTRSTAGINTSFGPAFGSVSV